MENGEWTKNVTKDGTANLLTAMSEAMAGIEAGETASSEHDCSALVAEDARSERKPEDEAIAEVGQVHRRSRGLRQGRLPVRRR